MLYRENFSTTIKYASVLASSRVLGSSSFKQRGVLIIPGHNFFPGLETGWQHTQECIRVSHAQDKKVVQEGIKIIAEEVAAAYVAR